MFTEDIVNDYNLFSANIASLALCIATAELSIATARSEHLISSSQHGDLMEMCRISYGNTGLSVNKIARQQVNIYVYS